VVKVWGASGVELGGGGRWDVALRIQSPAIVFVKLVEISGSQERRLGRWATSGGWATLYFRGRLVCSQTSGAPSSAVTGLEHQGRSPSPR
jgi:hypothetical protein